MNFGALLGGAAQGAAAGVQMMSTKKYADAYAKNAANADEEHTWKKQAQDRAAQGMKSIVDAINGSPLLTTPSTGAGAAAPAGTDGSTDAFNNQNAADVALMTPKRNPMRLAAFSGMGGASGGYAQGGLVQQIPDAVYAGQPQAAYQAGGLASPQQGMPPQQMQRGVPPPQMQQGTPPQAQQGAQPQAQQGDEPMSLSDQLSRAVMNSDVLNNPDKLNKIMAIADAHGIGDRIKPWLERYYTAKKSGMVDGAQSLMNGQVDGAMESFARGGLKLDSPPVKAKPDDSSDHNWIFSIGGKSQTMNVGDLLSRTVDYQKFQDYQMKQREQTDKERGTASEIAERQSRIGLNNANTQETQQKIADARRTGRLAASAENDKVDSGAIKRRDELLDRMSLSAQPGDDGKPMVDPARRAELAGISADAHDMLTQHFGKSLTSRQEHRLTDRLASAPDPSNVQAFTAWNLDLKKSFGVPLQQSQQPDQGQGGQLEVPAATVKQSAPARSAPAQSAPANTGGLASQVPERLAAPYSGTKYHDQMLAVQRALRNNPGLNPDQRANLALQANDIAARHAREYGGKPNG